MVGTSTGEERSLGLKILSSNPGVYRVSSALREFKLDRCGGFLLHDCGACGDPAAMANVTYFPFCYDHVHRPLFDEPAGRQSQGQDALTHLYRASTGKYLILSALEADVPRLDTVAGLAGILNLAKSERLAFLTKAIAQASESEWLDRLRAVDVGIAVCDNMENIRATNCRSADGLPGTDHGSYAFSVFEDHPSGHAVTQLDPYAVRPTDATIYATAPAEKYGASTRTVLRDLGYSEPEIQILIDSGAVSESWSREYLPS